MKPTILDVLIILCLRENPDPVVLDKAYFEKYSHFVCAENGFVIQEDVTHTQVSISLNNLLSFFLQKLLRAYKQDRLLPFEEYGFSALRLADNAELLVAAFFGNEPVMWNLEKNHLILGGHHFSHQGLVWALDILAAYFVVAKECQAGFAFHLQLDIPSGNICLFAHKSPEISATAQHLSKKCQTALANRAKWKVCYGDKCQLVMVAGSEWAELYGHPIEFRRGPDSKAHRLLWLCVSADPAKEFIPIPTAYSYVQNGRKYRPNYQLTNDEWDPTTKADDKKKLALICNARDLVNRRIQEVAKTYHFTTSISIFAGVEGTFITGQ